MIATSEQIQEHDGRECLGCKKRARKTHNSDVRKPYICKACRTNPEWRQHVLEAKRAYMQSWREKNRERCRAHFNKHYTENRETYLQRQKEARLKRKQKSSQEAV